MPFRFLLALLAAMSLLAPVRAADPKPPAKIPILLDTDIGDDIDDAFALALCLRSPEIDLRGVTTVFGDAHTRALIACRFLHFAGRPEIPVAAGAPPRKKPIERGQMQYGLKPLFRNRPVKESAVEFLYGQLKAHPGELTIVAVGPLSNVAELLTKHPDCKPWIKRLVIMGGSVRVGYNDKPPPDVEWNIKCDIKAAKVVFASGVPLTVAPLDATTSLKLEAPLRERIFKSATPLAEQLQALYKLWGQPTPTLFDPVAVTLVFTDRFVKTEDLHLEVDDKGYTRIGEGKPNAKVAVSVRRDDYLKWYAERIAAETPGK